MQALLSANVNENHNCCRVIGFSLNYETLKKKDLVFKESLACYDSNDIIDSNKL